jgi:hypothetical protein
VAGVGQEQRRRAAFNLIAQPVHRARAEHRVAGAHRHETGPFHWAQNLLAASTAASRLPGGVWRTIQA